ncbi:hypothetical protein PMIT1327_00671 [Prochlorococcus marinus str. MIT 1327]|nr:hypothetical protein PMIT1312_01011 [Prochlorococcus marinus str. MIT 1312]KZR83014.1 hypothetical protein PMIT1327_00671 [Prochlorococcus marinus str. MIT 1327]
MKKQSSDQSLSLKALKINAQNHVKREEFWMEFLLME